MKAHLGSFSLVSLLTLGTPTLEAATLTSVPMQGGMVMPMVSYKAADGRIHVQLDPAVPQLTPLLASNPADHFAADDPWYDILDPNRLGLAFSRRYGFVMGTMTDPLPAGTGIWLRKLSGSPEVRAYRYASTAPKAFEPIFGTAGAPPSMAWSGMMFHPTFAAPAGTNTYSATFDAHLRDAASGAELPNTTSDPFTLTWTSAPDGRPALSIAQKIVLSWPGTTGNLVLETSGTEGIEWTAVGESLISANGQTLVMVAPAATARIYRLRLVQ